MLKKTAVIFVIVATLTFILRLPFIVAPVSENDEGIYAALGHYLMGGETLYRDVWDNKLPAIYFVFGWIGQVLHDPLYFRLIGTILLLLAGALTYYLALKVLSRSAATITLIIFAFLSV